MKVFMKSTEFNPNARIKNPGFTGRDALFIKFQNNTILFLAFLLIVELLFSSGAFAASTFTLDKINGGKGGDPFVDMITEEGRMTSITIRSGAFIDSIKINYQYRNGNKVFGSPHGGGGGGSKTFIFRNGEYITTLGGRSGKYVDSIYIITNQGRSMRWGGEGGGNSFKISFAIASPLVGIWGRSGRFLDAIGVIQKSIYRVDHPKKYHRINYANNGNTAGGGGSNELVQRLIKPNGHVVRKYRDGTIKENYSGGFSVKRPGHPESRASFMTQAPPAIPPAIPGYSEKIWLEYHSQNLLQIIRTLVNNKQEAIDNYLDFEGVNSSVYKKIATRQSTIEYLVAP